MHDGETNAAAEQCDEYTRATSKAKFWPEQGQILAAKADRHTALAMALLIWKPAMAIHGSYPSPYLWDHLNFGDSVWIQEVVDGYYLIFKGMKAFLVFID